MKALPPSLAIGLWIVGSTWLLGGLALLLDMPGEVVWVAFLGGLFVGVYEWIVRRQQRP